MTLSSPRLLVFALAALALPGVARAQTTTTAQPPAAAAPAAPAPQDDDLRLAPAEPDFTLVALPTTLRLPVGKLAFRITHRFSYAINGTGNTTGDFFKNFLGFDSSARIAFELRAGLAPGTQVSISRQNTRAIQFLGQRQVLKQSGPASGASVDLVAAVEGGNNFSEDFAFSIGGILSHRFGEQGAIYVEPIGVFKPATAASVAGLTVSNRALFVGIGARVRLGKGRTYLVAEGTPRVAGYKAAGSRSQMSFGIEKRAGGHLFQLNFTRGFATSLRELGAGAPSTFWHIGFNLSRKFY